MATKRTVKKSEKILKAERGNQEEKLNGKFR